MKFLTLLQVKPQILSVFGDVALGIGLEFKPFLEMVLQTLAQASSLTCPDKVSFVRKHYFLFLLVVNSKISLDSSP